MEHRCGFVALIGAPNSGKSTLLNSLLGDKLAIVTSRPQTTRDNTLGILTLSSAQIIYVDTPGIHMAGKRFNRIMVEGALKALEDADMAYFIVDAAKGISPAWHTFFKEILTPVKTPVFLLLNKADLVDENVLQQRKEEFMQWKDFTYVDYISAVYPQSLHNMLRKTLELLPPSPPLYPDDIISDTTERFFVREVIREKLFEELHDELTYSCAVEIEEFREQEEEKDFIYAVIYVETQAQKKIVVGRKGKKLKKIGMQARQDIEKYLEREVFLELWVKVEKNWSKNPRFLKKLGYGDGKK